MDTQESFLDKLSAESKIKFLNEQQPLLDGVVKHLSDKLNDAKIEASKNKKQLDKLMFKGELCDLDYYDIRGGKCKYGAVYNGNIHCENPNCSNN